MVINLKAYIAAIFTGHTRRKAASVKGTLENSPGGERNSSHVEV